MDYEKGKKIEEVINRLQNLRGDYFNKPETDLDNIYNVVDRAITDLNRVLGKDY